MSKITEMQMKIAELLQANEAAMTLVEQLTAERDAFAIRLEDSEEQYSELHNKNSALAAQLVMIRKIFRDESLSTSETLRRIPFVIDLTPNQCLAELRAEAGVKGLRHGVALAAGGEISLDSILVKIWSDGYAEQIRQEGK